MNGEKVLVVEDEQHLAELAGIKLANAGYRVLTAADGAEALAKIKNSKPDLILLDLTLPVKDGFEVCYELRRDVETRDLPVILLLSKGQDPEQVRSMGLRVDDFLVKPFTPRDVLAKVNTLMARARYLKEANPLTGWPGRQLVYNQVARLLEEKRQFDLLFIDLDDFRIYNQVYGFAKGNEVIKIVAHTIRNAVADLAELDYYLGHAGGDDFLVLLPPQTGEKVGRTIVERFDAGIREMYTPEDRERGGIVAQNRQGINKQWPIMTISVALVSNEHREFHDPLELDTVGTELLRYAKSMPGSNYVWDRRRA
ncbi:MAG: response regulator [Firmicutes bacterium]|nr:response regulator [Bacillota bacterium]